MVHARRNPAQNARVRRSPLLALGASVWWVRVLFSLVGSPSCQLSARVTRVTEVPVAETGRTLAPSLWENGRRDTCLPVTASSSARDGPKKVALTLFVGVPKALRYCCGGIGQGAEKGNVEVTSGLQGSRVA